MKSLNEYFLYPLYMGHEIIGYVNIYSSAEELSWQYIRENRPEQVNNFCGVEFTINQFECVGNREFFNMEEI